jgi:hypothetical protein
MGRYVPRSGWAEHAKATAEKQQSITLVNQSFDERKIVVLRSDASDKTAKQNESDDHFRLALPSGTPHPRTFLVQTWPCRNPVGIGWTSAYHGAVICFA